MPESTSNTDQSMSDLVWFFILTFVISWVFWLPMLLPASPLTDFLTSPFNPAPFGPLIAALVMSYKIGKGTEVKDLLKSGIKLDFEKKWLLPALFLFPLLILLTVVLNMPMTESIIPAMTVELIFVVPISFFVILLTAGPLQEEFGWRGFALPRLQERYNALYSSIILGLIWSAWHLPLFLVYAGTTGTMYYQHPIWVMFIAVTSSTIIFTWVYNNTNGSVFATLLLHTSLNLGLWLFPILDSTIATYTSLVLFLIMAIIIVLVYGYKTFQRD